MAATESTRHPARTGAVIAAAFALPGVVAHAETAPEEGVLSLKVLRYQDSQPGLQRIRVTAPSIYALVPVNARWSVEGSLVSDAVSGASPRYHTAISGASRMSDERHAGDVKLNRYEGHNRYGMGLALSSEHDYRSRSLSFDAAFGSADNNRTWNLGLGLTSDRIGSSNDLSLHEKRRSTEVMFGLTQALSPVDLAQFSLTVQRGSGYFSDPYKELDVRPRTRNQTILMSRWNHHVASLGSTLRTSYRYYTDSFGIRAHTLSAEWVQPLSARWTLTPALRLYSQSAASFYFDPIYDATLGAPYPVGYFTQTPTYSSADQRLSAFGAITAGAKLSWLATRDWTADIKLDRYEQRSQWRIGGNGSIGLAPFSATSVQLGVSTRF